MICSYLNDIKYLLVAGHGFSSCMDTRAAWRGSLLCGRQEISDAELFIKLMLK